MNDFGPESFLDIRLIRKYKAISNVMVMTKLLVKIKVAPVINKSTKPISNLFCIDTFLFIITLFINSVMIKTIIGNRKVPMSIVNWPIVVRLEASTIPIPPTGDL